MDVSMSKNQAEKFSVRVIIRNVLWVMKTSRMHHFYSLHFNSQILPEITF